MTFLQLQNDVLERINNSSSEARVRVRRFLNEWHRRILTELGLEAPRRAETTLSVVAGTDEYTLSSTIARINGIQNEGDLVALAERSLEWMRIVDPDDSWSGTPEFYALRSDRKLKLKPKPDTNGTYTIDYEAQIAELDDDADLPLIHEDFHYLLVRGALINEYEKQDDMTRLAYAQKEMDRGMAKLRIWLNNRPRTVKNPGEAYSTVSRLGSQFPAGT